MRWRVLGVFVFATTACGGVVASTTADAGAPDARSTDGARTDARDASANACMARNERCPDATLDCRLYDCRHAVLSPKLVALIDSCFAASCADACRSPFEAFFAADATAAGLRDACLAKAKACPSDLYAWRCDDLGGIAEDRRADLQACLELPCGDVGA